MSSAPVIQWIRPGVGYAADAAASMLRLEAALGRKHDSNSSYRDYNKQLGMYRAWNAYVNGRGPKPPHARAIHPDYSMHCRGLADDSDDWKTPGYIALALEHGWVRTAAWDPTEQHHFEYQRGRDQHRTDTALSHPTTPQEEDDMFTDEDRKMLKATHAAVFGEDSNLAKTQAAAGAAATQSDNVGKVVVEINRKATTLVDAVEELREVFGKIIVRTHDAVVGEKSLLAKVAVKLGIKP